MRPKTLKRPLTSFSSVDSLSASLSSLSDDDDVDFDNDDQLLDEDRKVRKRANLDHLSAEEKLMRRKLKNRVAAQVGTFTGLKSRSRCCKLGYTKALEQS